MNLVYSLFMKAATGWEFVVLTRTSFALMGPVRLSSVCLEVDCFHPVVYMYSFIKLAVFTQQTNNGCKLLQLVNLQHVSALFGHHQAYNRWC